MESLRLKYAAQQVVLQEYLYAIHESETRVERYKKEMEVLAESSLLKPLIDALQALRGIAFISAATLVAEIGDLERFDHPANLMAYAGVVSSEYSSDQSWHQGRITKAGNAHVRRIIIESAWHYRKKPAVSKALEKRQEGLSEEIKAIAWKAQDRLSRKYRRMVGRGKLPQKAVVAVARELLGFIWAIGRQVAEEQRSGKSNCIPLSA